MRAIISYKYNNLQLFLYSATSHQWHKCWRCDARKWWKIGQPSLF